MLYYIKACRLRSPYFVTLASLRSAVKVCLRGVVGFVKYGHIVTRPVPSLPWFATFSSLRILDIRVKCNLITPYAACTRG